MQNPLENTSLTFMQNPLENTVQPFGLNL